MDVILDSNILGSDYQMRSARLAGLIDYLKRTGSFLVIPDAVAEEVLANYKRDLKKLNKDARTAWDALQDVLSSPSSCSFPNFDEEHARLRKKLGSPVRGVDLIGYKCDLDVLEIVRRGADRIAPARDDGEELRDVIIWLTVLRYAQEAKAVVGFITRDSGFWAKDGVKQLIQEDIAAKGVAVRLFKDVETFLKENNLRETVLTEDWVAIRLKVEPFEPQIVERIQSPYGWEIQRLKDIKYEKGILYDISNEAQFAEITYSFEVVYTPTFLTSVAMMAEYFTTTFSKQLSVTNPAPATTITTHAAEGSGIMGTRPTMSVPFGVDPQSRGTAQFSLRLVNGEVVKSELDQVLLEPVNYQVQWTVGKSQ